MAINFPDSPSVGDEFTGGGFTWTWSGSSWEKLVPSTTPIGFGFSIIVGSTGNTSCEFDTPQPAGTYSITSTLNDTTFDIYLVTANNENAGYTNTTSLEAASAFTKVVVYGATNNDVLNFDYKPSATLTSSGDLDDGVAPFLTSATPTTLESIDDTTTVTGGNFASDVEIVFTGQDAVNRAAKNIVRSSSTSLIVTRPDSFPIEQEPYSMTATNPGLENPSTNVNRLTNYFDAGGTISWITGATLPSGLKGTAYSATVEATDSDGYPVSYSITSGSLPSGLSLDNSTGVISGTPTAGGTIVFTITATDSGGNTSSREFSLLIVQLEADYLVLAGGGGSNSGVFNGGGGAGGYRTSAGPSGGGNSAESSLVLDLSTEYAVTVGAGGPIGEPVTSNGSSSVFASITSIGGGGGGNGTYESTISGAGSGGSGGGASGKSGAGAGAGTANQGFNGGGPGGNYSGGGGGGGGGASSQGQNGTSSGGGDGGVGLSSTITGSAVRRGGGGGGGVNFGSTDVGVGVDGGGNGGRRNNTAATPGVINTGGGGGGGGTTGSNGGSGIVVIKYPDIFSISVGPGLTSSTSTSGGYRVTTFTAGSDTVSFSQ